MMCCWQSALERISDLAPEEHYRGIFSLWAPDNSGLRAEPAAALNRGRTIVLTYPETAAAAASCVLHVRTVLTYDFAASTDSMSPASSSGLTGGVQPLWVDETSSGGLMHKTAFISPCHGPAAGRKCRANVLGILFRLLAITISTSAPCLALCRTHNLSGVQSVHQCIAVGANGGNEPKQRACSHHGTEVSCGAR
jgi:hypothetical protein